MALTPYDQEDTSAKELTEELNKLLNGLDDRVSEQCENLAEDTVCDVKARELGISGFQYVKTIFNLDIQQIFDPTSIDKQDVYDNFLDNVEDNLKAALTAVREHRNKEASKL